VKSPLRGAEAWLEAGAKGKLPVCPPAPGEIGGQSPGAPLLGLLGGGKQQLISVGIDDLDHVVTPPGLLGRN
jgi:hypothetical protein